MEEKIALVSSQDTFKMIIPKEVEDKIRYACKEVHDIEWSGALFYNYTGNFKDKNLVITCKDFFIMDIGNATYTEFDMNPDVVSYMCNHQELLDTQIGLIHSHNNMATFFSGTDQDTLREEGNDRNIFVSLIVNNAGNYTAAVTRKKTSTQEVKECYSYHFFGEGEEKECEEYTINDTVIEYFKLDIEKEGQDIYSEMSSRLDEIRKDKETKKKETFKSTPYISPYYNTDYSLFNKESFNNSQYKSSSDYIKPNYNDVAPGYDIDYSLVHMDENKLESYVMQLLISSIAVYPKDSDAIKWSEKMPKLYEKRFGKGQKGLLLFKTWAETFVEYLITYTEDDKLSELGYSDDEITSIYAYDIKEALKQLPSNDYLDIYIETLDSYIL